MKKNLRNLWEQTVVDIWTVAEELDMDIWRARQILKANMNILKKWDKLISKSLDWRYEDEKKQVNLEVWSKIKIFKCLHKCGHRVRRSFKFLCYAETNLQSIWRKLDLQDQRKLECKSKKIWNQDGVLWCQSNHHIWITLQANNSTFDFNKFTNTVSRKMPDLWSRSWRSYQDNTLTNK